MVFKILSDTLNYGEHSNNTKLNAMENNKHI